MNFMIGHMSTGLLTSQNVFRCFSTWTERVSIVHLK